MPSVSEAQRKAMYAAAEGKSNLGIPASVGKEFIGRDGKMNAELLMKLRELIVLLGQYIQSRMGQDGGPGSGPQNGGNSNRNINASRHDAEAEKHMDKSEFHEKKATEAANNKNPSEQKKHEQLMGAHENAISEHQGAAYSHQHGYPDAVMRSHRASQASTVANGLS